MKNILFAASEAVPYMKTGGLADVVGSLPGYFDRKYFDCRVIMPRYMCIDEKLKKTLRYVHHFYMDYNGASTYVGILTAENDGITYYFVDNEDYFSGPTPYSGGEYDIQKFVFFNLAVLSACPVIGFSPDIIHCNDWHTGLIPVLLRERFSGTPCYKKTKTVITIHNLKFQGIWNIDSVKKLSGLPDNCFTVDTLEFWRNANMLKGGIVYADAVTTVSRSYADEIQTPEYGEALDGLLRRRAGSLRGIINGIDYEQFNPMTDRYLYSNFGPDDFADKRAINKAKLQKENGLDENKESFMLGMVSRMTDQKGFDLVAQKIDEICAAGMQMIVLGTGEDRYQDMFRYFMNKYPKQLLARITYSEELASLFYASCDAFLMPSRFEPCGLSQLIALRYGAVPIVRKTGGLQDTVDEKTGFLFESYDAGEMMKAVAAAHDLYTNNKSGWKKMIKNGMKKDYSWNKSALKYQEMYDWLSDNTTDR